MEIKSRKKFKNSVIEIEKQIKFGNISRERFGRAKISFQQERKEIFIRYKSVFEFMLSIDYDDSGKLLHRAPDGTAKIWLIRSERDYCWLPLNTVSTMLRGVDKGESRRGGRRAKRATRIFHSRQTPANAQVEKISVRRKFGLEIPTPPPNLRPPEETGPPPVFIRRRKLTLPKYVTGRVEIPIRLCIGSTERKSVDARRV